MVGQMVEMERSYLTAEVFREILASSTATDQLADEAGVVVRPWHPPHSAVAYRGHLVVQQMFAALARKAAGCSRLSSAWPSLQLASGTCFAINARTSDDMCSWHWAWC